MNTPTRPRLNKPVIRLKSWSFGPSTAGLRLEGRAAPGTTLSEDTQIFDHIMAARRHENGRVLVETHDRIYQLGHDPAREERLLTAMTAIA